MMPQPALPTGTVAFLFTDIEGSTKRWQAHREAMGVAVARHDALLRREIEIRGGYVFKTVGDAFCAAFPTAPLALAAAVAAQRALAADPWEETGPIRARMALHVGVAEERDDDYFGPALNRVARLLAAGHGGQVLLSGAAHELVQDTLPADVGLRDLGAQRLKDLDRPERVFQVVAPDLPSEFPPLRTLDARPHNLPITLTSFVGRDREIATVREILLNPETRLATLTGPGGTGKTRLALQVAIDLLDAFPDGVFLVGLAPVRNPALVAPTVVQALGLRETPGLPVVETLTEFLRDKALLLVLDNFEHVIEAAPLVATLLSACLGLKVLVTSRQALRVSGEREVAVPPLALPGRKPPQPVEELTRIEAVQLFVERARGVKADFALTDANAAAVAEVCRRLDGLPLAIELVAARVKLLTPQAMLPRLEKRLALLVGGGRDVPPRQQSLRAAIAWSHDLLTLQEQALFRRLAVFVGGCTLEAAEAVCSVDGEAAADIVDGMASLVDTSLLQTEDGAGDSRYLMLETIREYALERLAACGDGEELRAAHATYFLSLAERAATQLVGPAQTAWLDGLTADHDNFRAALGWVLTSKHDDGTLGMRLAVALWQFWHPRGYIHEGRDWLERAVASGSKAESSLRARAFLALADSAENLEEYAYARTLYASSLAIYRELGADQGVARALVGMAVVATDQGDYGQARSLLTESLALWRRLKDRPGSLSALSALGAAARAERDYDTAEACFREAMQISQELGDAGAVAYLQLELAQCRRYRGEFEHAERLARDALAWFREVREERAASRTLGELGRLATEQEHVRGAVELFEEALVMHEELMDRLGTALCLDAVTMLAVARGRPEQALQIAGAVAAWRATTGSALPLPDREALEKSLALARAQLEPSAADEAWTRGQRLGLAPAASYAMSVLAGLA